MGVRDTHRDDVLRAGEDERLPEPVESGGLDIGLGETGQGVEIVPANSIQYKGIDRCRRRMRAIGAALGVGVGPVTTGDQHDAAICLLAGGRDRLPEANHALPRELP